MRSDGRLSCLSVFFFFNDTATTEIYTLSLHDALPILRKIRKAPPASATLSLLSRIQAICPSERPSVCLTPASTASGMRSEEHTSELQSRQYLVCRLLLEKKKQHRLPYSSHSMIRVATS